MSPEIVLIIPPSPFLGDEKRQPPLGILYVAAFLEQQGVDVKMADLRALDHSDWLDCIPRCNWYGITATTPEYPYAVGIAMLLKGRDPYCKIMLGGVHATAVWRGLDPIFDVVITAEGEIASYFILTGKSGITGPIEYLDKLPFPARHLLPRDSFVSSKLCEIGEDATALITSRGCPHNCSFCASSVMWGRKVRYRSVGNVISELQMLKDEYGIRQVRFQDDTMTVNKSWIMEFCRAVAPLNMRWRSATRVDHSSPDMLQAMFDAGCYELGYGIEDPAQDVLNINAKGIKTKDIYKALSTAKRIGFKTRIFLMIGLPGQGDDTASRLIEFIERVQPNVADLSSFVPYPGSDVYYNPDKYGIKLKNIPWSDYVLTRGLYGDEYNIDFTYQHDKLSNDELKRQRKTVLDYIKTRRLALAE